MGAFIIDDPSACNQCHRVLHSDGSPVTWTCVICRKLVCRHCAQMDRASREILSTTLCSEDCKAAYDTEAKVFGRPTADEEDD